MGNGICYLQNLDVANVVDKNKNNIKNGKCIYIYPTGDKYDGEWINNNRNGKGILYYASGDKYDGEWEDDKANGKGILYSASGDKYDGEWKDNKLNGKGIMIYRNGSKYEGEWKNCKKIGNSTMIYVNGNKYDGEWNDDSQNGKGIMIYANGDKYDGEWSYNYQNRKGIMIYVNGNKYDGEWRDDARHGKGVMIYANGDKYDGEWSYNHQNGKGIIIYANGDKYEGELKNDKKVGKGIMIYANGDKYEGEWKDDARNGKGIMIYANGDVCSGNFEDESFIRGSCIKKDGSCFKGEMVNNMFFGHCEISYSDDSFYVGEVCENLPNGFGFKGTNNEIISGTWKNGIYKTNESEPIICHFCCKSKSSYYMVSSCGKCLNRICVECQTKYYKEHTKGIIYLKEKFLCPFCREIPFTIIANINVELMKLLKDPECKYIGKCQYCLFYYKTDIEQNCSQDIVDFTCGKCLEFQGTKKCPECGVLIEKNGGCNHITCKCNHEFCWKCLEKWKNFHSC